LTHTRSLLTHTSFHQFPQSHLDRSVSFQLGLPQLLPNPSLALPCARALQARVCELASPWAGLRVNCMHACNGVRGFQPVCGCRHHQAVQSVDVKALRNVCLHLSDLFACRTHPGPFFREFDQMRWERFNSDKICLVTYARIQVFTLELRQMALPHT
jgi:hypothetical protein